ncbi:hypothetical protein Tco_0448124 [Tanacetum coccineum]
MPAFYAKQNPGSKKAKTSKTTSGSAQGGLNLNEDATSSDEELHLLHKEVLLTWLKSFKVVGWGKKKEQQQSYIDLKNQELEIQKKANREAAELKRQKLELKRKTLELKLTMKRDKDLCFYMKKIDETLPPIQQEKLMEMKQQIKEPNDLDF